MNWDTIKGSWKQVQGEAKTTWGKITNDEWEQIDGNKDKLVGFIQEKYGETKEAAEKQVDEWSQSDTMKNLQAKMHEAGESIKSAWNDMTGSKDAETSDDSQNT